MRYTQAAAFRGPLRLLSLAIPVPLPSWHVCVPMHSSGRNAAHSLAKLIDRIETYSTNHDAVHSIVFATKTNAYNLSVPTEIFPVQEDVA